MAQPEVWFWKNDMALQITGLRSSTMSTGTYLASSTGLTVSVFDGESTSDTVVINSRNVPYVTTPGFYRTMAQSTETSALTVGQRALAVFTLNHSGLNAEWRLPFRVDYRRST